MPKPITETAVETPVEQAQDENLVPVRKPKQAKKAPAKKQAAKAPAAKAAPVSKHDPATSPVRWTEKKLALLRALKQANAVSAQTGIAKERIEKLSKGKALTNLNPSFDITVQGYIGQAKLDEGVTYYITKKGLSVLAKAV